LKARKIGTFRPSRSSCCPSHIPLFPSQIGKKRNEKNPQFLLRFSLPSVLSPFRFSSGQIYPILYPASPCLSSIQRATMTFPSPEWLLTKNAIPHC
jgi:hypothetical protein